MIVILGADGLLGSHIVRRFPQQVIGLTHRELDVTDAGNLQETLYQIMPDAVINCAGITPHHSHLSTDYIQEVNTEAPHNLATLGDQLGFKLIQVSTNCVFDLKSGAFTEKDSPVLDAGSYGRTKALGEVTTSPVHLTVRTSFVGWPDPKGRGLLAWLYKNRNQSVPGYRGCVWNGLTTTVLADALFALAYEPVSGVRHLFGQELTKYEVLKIVNDRFDWDCDIVPVDYPEENAGLSTIYNDAVCHLPAVDFEEQVDMLYRAGHDYA